MIYYKCLYYEVYYDHMYMYKITNMKNYNVFYIHVHTNIYIYIYIYIKTHVYIHIYCYSYCYFYLVESFHPNLDDVFTYNHMSLMSLRSRSRVKASVVLTRADHLYIHNYIRSLLNSILRPILMVLTRLEPMSYCLSRHTIVCLMPYPHRQYI